MNTARLEAFSDGVLAIVITIMVLELKIPHGAEFSAIVPLLPVFLSYILSFIYVAIYWNNHHHLLTFGTRATAREMWANMHLLFWLSLVPFATGWVGESHGSAMPAACYGVVLLMAAVAYKILQIQIISSSVRRDELRAALGRDVKGMISPVIYLVAIGLAFVKPMISYVLYALVALMWIVPDRRLERLSAKNGRPEPPRIVIRRSLPPPAAGQSGAPSSRPLRGTGRSALLKASVRSGRSGSSWHAL